MPTIAERVAKGAEWLDENRPGWWEEGPGGIDLGRLDMASACLCVLGQLYAEFAWQDENGEFTGFDHAADILRVPDIEYGFNISWRGAPTAELRTEHFSELDTEWKRLIAERRSTS